MTSTTTGTYSFIIATSNVLQGEINSIVAGGTTSLWANYRAITNVDLSGYELRNATKLSTMDLQVSSINGSEFSINDNTQVVKIGGLTINNNSIIVSTVNSKTTNTSNSALSQFVNATNSVASAVTNINSAVGGFLSNNFGVIQQAYYGVAIAGQVVDLANGTVQLATGVQAMVDSREINSISGPAGPPGQTNYVYETFNHTTQFQFSTIGAPIVTVFRTTDQRYPNSTFGREVFISTTIPAGSKVVRSVSDPINMPIASSILLSTTNFIQSFGQWSAVLGNDYNVTASTIFADYIKASTISTLVLSTGVASISSINGVNINTILSPPVLPSGLVSTPWNIGLVSTQNLQGLVSTQNLQGLVSTQNLQGLVSTPNLVNLQSLTVSTGLLTANTIYVSTLFASTSVTVNFIDTNISTTVATVNQLNTSSINITGGMVFSTSYQAGITAPYNIRGFVTSTAAQYTGISSLTQNIMNWTMNGTLTASEVIVDLPGGTSIYSGNEPEWLNKFLMYSSPYVAAITVYLLNANNTGDFFDIQNRSGVTGNTVTISQGGAAIKVIQPGDPNVYRYTWNGSVFVQSANPTPTGQAILNQFTMTQSFTATTFSTANELIINAGQTNFLNPVDMPYGFITNLYASNVSLSTVTAGAISSLGGITFGTPSTITDLSKTTSLNALTGSQLTGHFNNILNYEFDTTVVTEPIITYPFPPGGGTEFFWQQVGTWGGVINTFAAGGNPRVTLFLGLETVVPPPASGFTDIQNANQTNGIQVYYTGGSIVVPLGSIYRFSWTYSPLVWSINTSPSPATATTLTNFTIKQDFAGVAISTSDILNVNATSIFLNAPYTQAAKFVAEAGYFSTLQTEFISTGNLQIANISTGTIAATGAITAGGNVTAGGNLTAAGNVAGVNGTFTGALSGVSLTTTGDVNARNVISVSSITNAVYTSNTDTNINQYNVKSFTTSVYYNTLTSTFGTGSRGSISSVSVYGNSAKFYAYPGLSNIGIANGLPGGQYYYLRSDGTTTIGTSFPGTNPASPNPWWSSIITVYNNVAGDFLVFDNTNAIGECYIQTMGTTALNYQMLSGAGISYVAPTTVPSYYKLIWNTFSNAVLTPVSGPYTPALQNQLTSFDVGVNNSINLTASNVTFANKQVEMFQQTFDGYLVRGANGLYSKADAAGTITNPSGKTYPISDWACICSLAGINVYGQFNLALNEQLVTTGNDGAGNWFAHCYCTTATISGGNNPHVYWNIAITMVPRIIGTPVSFQTATNLGDTPPPIAQELPWLQLSSINASTITVEATENIALLANVVSPAFISTGSIYIAGTNNVNLVGNITAVGGFTDVDIDAVTGNVNIVATAKDINLNANSNINIVADNYVYISSGSYMNTDVYGDMSTDLGGVYTVTSAEVINLNGSNGIGLTSGTEVNITAGSGNVNLTASSLIYTGASPLWGSNVGNDLGLYRPLRFYYEPSTAAGQSAEINIEAHPADAGVHFSLRYGVDLAGGYGYLLCEWPGYIVVPMKIYGQDITLEGGETIHINANSGNVTLHATGSVVTDAPINMCNHNINAANTIQATTITNNTSNSDYLTLTATSSIILRASNAIEFNSDGNYFNNFVTMNGNTFYTGGGSMYMNNGYIFENAGTYFYYGGNIASVYDSGINYLTISAPSGTGKLRLFGNKGNLIFDDNVGLAGNGSNQVGLYNQYGYIYLAPNQNVYIGGGGSHTIGEDQIIVHGLIYSDSRIYTNASGQGFYHQNSNAFIKTECLYGTYGSLSLNGYLTVCEAGTTSAIFTVSSDTNGNMWYNNGTGGFGIGTTTPVCKLDVITGSLGTTAGDTITIQRLGNSNGNANYIRVNQVRETGGSDWTTTATRIQQMTDVTNQAYLQFNGTSNTYGASIGTPALDNAFVVKNSGYIGVGTWTPAYKLDVVGDIGLSGNLYTTSIQNNTGILSVNTSNGLKLTDLATGGSGTFTIDASNHLYWNGTFIA